MKISQTLTQKDQLRVLSPIEQKLANTIFHQNLGYQAGESILIVTDPNMLYQAAAVWFEAAKKLSQLPTKIKLLVVTGMTHSGQEPPAEVVAAATQADITFLHTTFSLTHTQAGKAALKNGGRGASLPGVDQQMMIRTLDTDYQQLQAQGDQLKLKLAAGKTIRITAPSGTEITADIRTQAIENDAGILGPGQLGNLPAGEVFFAPLLGTTQGTWVVNGSLADEKKLTEPVVITINNGLATKITGGPAAKRLHQKLDKLGPTAFTVAEIGLGTNRSVNPLGEVIEAEKAYGTAHLALGNSSAIGGEVNVPIHIDGICLEVTVEIDGQVIITDGEIKLK